MRTVYRFGYRRVNKVGLAGILADLERWRRALATGSPGAIQSSFPATATAAAGTSYLEPL